MIVVAKQRHRLELILWILGIALCGAAAQSTLTRWYYQQQQERALFQGGPALPVISVTPQALSEPVAAPPPVTSSLAVEAPPPAAVAALQPKTRLPVADPLAIGRIEIPRLGLRAIVRKGEDDKTLTRAVGLVPGSALPGESGNMVLAGHRDTFFWPLQDVAVGDQIRMVVPGRTYRYRVDSVRVVEPDETGVLGSRGVEELTLVTCYPFTWVGPAPERFVVAAKRVN